MIANRFILISIGQSERNSNSAFASFFKGLVTTICCSEGAT
jgi:hypothetical protein